MFNFFSLEGMSAGQTLVTVTIVAYNDLIDAVQLDDRYRIYLLMTVFYLVRGHKPPGDGVRTDGNL
jgi:hypothetical protein